MNEEDCANELVEWCHKKDINITFKQAFEIVTFVVEKVE